MTVFAALPADLIVGAAYRMLVLVTVLVVGWRVRKSFHWPIGVACVTGIGSNVAFILGDLRMSAILAVPYIGLMGWIFIRKMQDDPQLMRALLARKEAEWSKQRHDLVGELATVRAQLDFANERESESGRPDDVQ